MTVSASSANRPRDTAGRMLLGWAMLLVPLVTLSWRVHLHPDEFEWIEYPTALGDDRFYTPMDADLYGPNLKLEGPTVGLFRRDLTSRAISDEQMHKVARDASGSWFVYVPQGQSQLGRVYLKTGHGRYMEFGERAHYMPFSPSIPTEKP